MPPLKSWGHPESASLLARSRGMLTNGALLAANTRAMAELGPPPDTDSQDIRGQALRLLRIQKSWEPVALATQACISLRQLYQLESGETSLFYSTGLRNQAGRRVAAILGSQWDDLMLPLPATHQDKHLKLVSPTEPTTSEIKANTETPTAAQTTLPGSASLSVPFGRDKPATDTLVMPVPVTAQINHRGQAHLSPAPTSSRGLSVFWTLVGWLLAGLAGAGSVEAFFLLKH